VDITAMSANRGMICVGDADGFVHLANRQLEARKFQAHEHFVSHVVMVRGGHYGTESGRFGTHSHGHDVWNRTDEAQQRVGDGG
jgi:hypothetical protein